MQKLNVAFIGLGRIADLHFEGYKNNKKAQLYAVCDTNTELVKKRETQWKAVAGYRDDTELLSDPRVDAVEILTPHTSHERIAVAAAQAGKHIALQKPMTIDLASADRILEATKQSGKIFRVTDNYAFYPPIRIAKKIIENGDIGNPISIRIKFIGGGSGGWYVPPEAWQWRLKENTESGGIRGFDTKDAQRIARPPRTLTKFRKIRAAGKKAHRGFPEQIQSRCGKRLVLHHRPCGFGRRANARLHVRTIHSKRCAPHPGRDAPGRGGYHPQSFCGRMGRYTSQKKAHRDGISAGFDKNRRKS